tara:strand:- start:2622 stop:4289 length:1668 start_codon:yes stop_codon:yes gene_type:complete
MTRAEITMMFTTLKKSDLESKMPDIELSSLQLEEKKNENCLGTLGRNGLCCNDEYVALKKWLVCLKFFGLGYKYFWDNESDFSLTQSRGTQVALKESLMAISGILENSSGEKDPNMDKVCTNIKKKIIDLKRYRRSKKEKDRKVTSFCNNPFIKDTPSSEFPPDIEDPEISPFSNSQSISKFLDRIPDDFSIKKVQKSNCTKNCIEIFYSLMILSFLSYIPILDVVHFRRNKRIINIIELCFDLVPISQYVCGAIYFRSPHFRHFLFSKVLKNEYSYKDFSNWPPYIAYSTYLSAVIGGVGYLFFSRGPLLHKVMLFFHGFYEFPILLSNSTVFFMILNEHKLEMEYMRDAVKRGNGCIEKKEEGTVSDREPINISKLITNLNGFRYSLEKSTASLNCIFSNCVFFGFVGSGILIIVKVKAIRKGKLDLLEDDVHMYAAALIWAILFASYMQIAGGVTVCKREIVEFLRSPYYTRLYLSRLSLGTGVLGPKNDSRLNMLMNYETSTTIEWGILNNILSEEWKEFNIAGVGLVSKMQAILGAAFVSVVISATKVFI